MPQKLFLRHSRPKGKFSPWRAENMDGKQYLTLFISGREHSSSYNHSLENFRKDGWMVWELTSGQVIAQHAIYPSSDKEHYIGAGKQFANHAFSFGRRLIVRIERQSGQVSVMTKFKLAEKTHGVAVKDWVVFKIQGPFHSAKLEALPSAEKGALAIDLGSAATQILKSGTYKVKRSKPLLEKFRQMPAQ
jgi:hypothetical protein